MNVGNKRVLLQRSECNVRAVAQSSQKPDRSHLKLRRYFPSFLFT